VYEVQRGITRISITAVFTISVAGMMCPPMPICIYKMFEEIVGNQLVTELKKIEVKIRQILL
jgi:hypothetical protein